MTRTKNKYTHTYIRLYDQRTVRGEHIIYDRFKPVKYNTQHMKSYYIIFYWIMHELIIIVISNFPRTLQHIMQQKYRININSTRQDIILYSIVMLPTLFVYKTKSWSNQLSSKTDDRWNIQTFQTKPITRYFDSNL